MNSFSIISFSILALIVLIATSLIHSLLHPQLSNSLPPTYCVGEARRGRWYQQPPGLLGLGMLLRHSRSGGTVLWRYVIGDYVSLLLFLLAFWQAGGWQPELAAAVWLTVILVIIVQTDLTHMLIPNKVVLVGTLGAIVIRCFWHPLPWYEYVIGAFSVSLVLLLIALVGERLLRKEVMGGGDIKLYVFIGAMLGYKLTLLSLFVASVFGLIMGLIMLRVSKQDTNKVIPFGPYIAAGVIVTYYWGENLIGWYVGLLQG